MEDFENNKMSENTDAAASSAENSAADVSGQADGAANSENAGQPSGWSYSNNTNQYRSYEGAAQGADAHSAAPDAQGAAPDAGSQWQNAQQQGAPQNNAQQTPPQQGYGAQYGYYSSRGVDPQYSGTQNPYNSQTGGYQWNFDKYENADHSGKKPGGGKKSGRGFKVFLGIVAAVLGVCVLTFAVFGAYSLASGGSLPFGLADSEQSSAASGSQSSEASASTTQNENAPTLSLAEKPETSETITTDGEMSATQIYDKVSPSIVGVVQYQYATSIDAAGEGSGIILTSDGYIATNAHVVSGADAIKVVLYNNEEYEATLVGSDAQTDIAVLKIDATNLTPATLGDSTQCEVGETVYALGNPGGLTLQSSFTNGIISGLNRVITTSESAYSLNVIQTNAAINPGNSGGALINEFGQVIGITNSKLISTSYEGIGFAIPISDAQDVIAELISQGYVSGRPILGITGTTIDSTVAQMYNVPQGVQIRAINSRSALTGTDAAAGDIIIAFDSTDITSMTDLQTALQAHAPGDQVVLTLYRYSATGNNDKTFKVTITLLEDNGTNTAEDSQIQSGYSYGG
mgnify:CR=1 FL=1